MTELNVDQWRLLAGDYAMTNRVLELELQKAQARIRALEERYEPKVPVQDASAPSAAEKVESMRRARNDKLADLTDHRMRGAPHVIDAVAAEIANGAGKGAG